MEITSIISSGTIEGFVATPDNPVVVGRTTINPSFIRKLEIVSVIDASRFLVSARTTKIVGNTWYAQLNSLPPGNYYLYAVINGFNPNITFGNKTFTLRSAPMFYTVLADNYSKPTMQVFQRVRTVNYKREHKEDMGNGSYQISGIFINATNATSAIINLSNNTQLSITGLAGGVNSIIPLIYKPFGIMPQLQNRPRAGLYTSNCTITVYGPYGSTSTLINTSLRITGSPWKQTGK